MATSQGEKSLTTLLSTLTTILHPSTFAFVTVAQDFQIPSSLVPKIQMSFREAEGLTLITTLEDAQAHNLEYSFPCRMITLNVHSSLEAVGFMAVIATKLAEKGMGVNPVSGFFHDHCFVPDGREEEAMKVLEDIARDSKT